MEKMAEQLTNLQKMVDEYFSLEEKILQEIKKLPEYGKDCDCDDPNRFCIVDDDVTVCMCLNCGGNIYW